MSLCFLYGIRLSRDRSVQSPTIGYGYVCIRNQSKFACERSHNKRKWYIQRFNMISLSVSVKLNLKILWWVLLYILFVRNLFWFFVMGLYIIVVLAFHICFRIEIMSADILIVLIKCFLAKIIKYVLLELRCTHPVWSSPRMSASITHTESSGKWNNIKIFICAEKSWYISLI